MTDNTEYIIHPDYIRKATVFIPRYNSKGKKDVTGAFHPEAVKFCHVWGKDEGEIISLNNRHRRRDLADSLLNKMESAQNDSPVWIFFCHGYTHGIQFGIRSPQHKRFGEGDRRDFNRFIDVVSLSAALASTRTPVIVLYACSTGNDPDGDSDTAPGSGDGSFGDLTRDRLCESGAVNCRVFTHATAGHTTLNPMVKIFDGEGKPYGDNGGKLVAPPGSRKFNNLRKKLRRDQEFRFHFPFMSMEDIGIEIR